MRCFSRSCLSIIEFRRYGRYINPCRISPLDVLIKSVPGSTFKYHLHGADRKVLVCLVPVLCRNSYLMEPNGQTMRKKYITGIFHSQEWERFIGFICTAFDQLELEAQLLQDAIQFATRPESAQGMIVSSFFFFFAFCLSYLGADFLSPFLCFFGSRYPYKIRFHVHQPG